MQLVDAASSYLLRQPVCHSINEALDHAIPPEGRDLAVVKRGFGDGAKNRTVCNPHRDYTPYRAPNVLFRGTLRTFDPALGRLPQGRLEPSKQARHKVIEIAKVEVERRPAQAGARHKFAHRDLGERSLSKELFRSVEYLPLRFLGPVPLLLGSSHLIRHKKS